MSDILREVDDAMRADNMARLWQEHKAALVTGIAALILGTAAMTAWNSYKLDKNQKQTGQTLTALEAVNPADALSKVAATQSGAGRAISLINAAAAELKAGHKDKALDYYMQATTDKSGNATFHDLAVLQKTNLTLDLKPDVKADELLSSLAPIVKNKKSPWSGEAAFMSAFIKGEKNNDFKGAANDLEALQARDDVTESIKQRAQALQSVYDLKAGK